MLFPKKEYYCCNFCGKRVALRFGSPTPALIAHMENHHEDLKEKYWDLPIHDMVKACFHFEEEKAS